jgi:peroxiredoxin
MKSPAKLIAVLAVVAIGAFAAFLLTPQRSAPEARFALLTGKSFVTSELRGKVTVVNFWATWCPDCVKEMPRMVEAHRKYSTRGYETVAVAVRDRPERVAEFARKRALPFRVALDTSGDVSRQFGNVRITPTTFIIDKKGRMLRRFVGEPEWSEFDRIVEKALAEPA